ncbi:MAG: hypothetical protein J6D47_18645 [Peptostreptococcaceae bacterium]|nr:hypothetical protein [Peptostreptococcaceae bacterium]
MTEIKYIYVIEYDGRISKEGYDSLNKALNHLRKQGYNHKCGWSYKDTEGRLALIHEIKIV